MNDNEKLIEEARHAATYPDVRPISYRLVKRLADALEAAEKALTPTGETHHMPGFAERERRAASAWGSYSHTDRDMSHEFRSGYHRGVIDEVRRSGGTQ